ncbi:NAD(P)/FAD-dependent oxidoreductase [Kibdelosporangium phytohabitans]|uniref:Pyridine nucleotide-disulfide oxidoreductase n=1 Tax=Kibdelosporangium phytohabitans TaxID=860235 RepID=A0A0N9HRC5_9PSEU|nr:FAD-dependent oxidoreductase [Kibdelosporangium phytohabitans]ALG05584.1 pyridine nucleotide-disulfide oxidoreductase [Kibdelosporangium phytohabitans]MBE1466453.1 NADPH-dependent 2,4-dienoyl-CoA reductase/sulfur reductase-like enzyme [Kibdelosporangium phytohabitans]
MRTITVVGASIAGLSAARALRAQEFAGRIVVIGDEPHEPYDRPPLSKGFLDGSASLDDIALSTPDDKLLDIDWRLGSKATALDTSSRTVVLDTGERVVTDAVVLATGARAREMPGPAGVYTLRTLEDAVALKQALNQGGSLVVIGAGFIGAEVASTARQLGLDVTVLETLPTPMAGPLGPEMGQVCAELHGRHGVKLITGVPVSTLVGDDRVRAVRLADGREIPADIVVAGIGAVPNVEWLLGSGLTIDGGVVTDARCMTNLPHVVAVGDCASAFNDHAGRVIRLEHWTSAVQQPKIAAASLLGRTSAHAARFSVPYFWSDQYGSRLQFAGHRRDGDDVEIVEGSPDGPFVAVYRRDSRPVAVLAVDQPRVFGRWRRELASEGVLS